MIFTDHAFQRYRQRCLKGEELVEKALKERAWASFHAGQLVSKLEAQNIIQAPIPVYTADSFYKADSAGSGVWVAVRGHRGTIVIVTYLSSDMSGDTHAAGLLTPRSKRKTA